MTRSGGSGRVTRRGFLAGAAGLAGAGVGAAAVGIGRDRRADTESSDRLDFYGRHQAGITTPQTRHANYVGLNLIGPPRAPMLSGLLTLWTQDGARLTRGTPGLADPEPELATSPSRLTVTVGVGPGVFATPELASRRPEWLKPLPAFGIDRLQERWAQTDLLLLLAADDPLTLAHATRVLTAEVRTLARVAWVQRGFYHRRNLFGQVDGTEQPPNERHDDLVWDDGAEQPWLAGGTSMVIRRIAMHMDTWEELDRGPRELVIGRNLDNGAPLSGTEEHDEPDFTRTVDGLTMIPASSHIARARRRSDVEQYLRRSYHYDEAPEPTIAHEHPDTSNSGLIFTAIQRDPLTQFLPSQERLAEHDDLNVWTTPIGSAVYAILPGATPEAPLGASLLRAGA